MDDSPSTPSIQNQSKTSSLNLPSNISRTNLSLDLGSSPSTPSSSSSSTMSRVDRLVGVGYHPSPSRTIYSDRFIPNRTGSNFALFVMSPNKSEGKEDGSSGTYATLLRNVMFVETINDECPLVISNGPKANKF
ncbi:hypothetical protein ACHQM5_026715 [Ranunculus cassubicifolius]